MVEHVALLRIEEQARLFIAHERIGVPALPESQHHVGELARALVAFFVSEVLFAVEVVRFFIMGGRDDVPARAAVTDEIE
jgi:hypothetical protein